MPGKIDGIDPWFGNQVVYGDGVNLHNLFNKKVSNYFCNVMYERLNLKANHGEVSCLY